MPAMMMSHVVDPADDLLRQIGDISEVELFSNQVLVAIYVRPEKTLSGIILTDSVRDEDKNQGKVGLVVKMGSKAFVDPERKWFDEVERSGDDPMKVGDWAFLRASDGWAISINKTPCRIVDDTNVRGRVQHPDVIW